MKVIKVVTRAPFDPADYGAEINISFAQGTKEQCLQAIREDISWNATCYVDSGSRLSFINGHDIDMTLRGNALDELIEELTPDEYVQHVIRLEEDDADPVRHEITYRILKGGTT